MPTENTQQKSQLVQYTLDKIIDAFTNETRSQFTTIDSNSTLYKIKTNSIVQGCSSVQHQALSRDRLQTGALFYKGYSHLTFAEQFSATYNHSNNVRP